MGANIGERMALAVEVKDSDRLAIDIKDPTLMIGDVTHTGYFFKAGHKDLRYHGELDGTISQGQGESRLRFESTICSRPGTITRVTGILI